MDEAKTRRERLAALRQAAKLTEGDAAEAEAKPVLKFRNYVPKDQEIEHTKVKPAQPPSFKEPKPKQEEEKGPNDEVIIDVAPKKANWDLKRDIAKKLEKLERRTQRALIELMQEEEKRKFEAEGGVADKDEAG
eukprot:evm.model.scf_42.12 EVM.evm.TU.scf_42.12   scf_42:83153-85453(+)